MGKTLPLLLVSGSAGMFLLVAIVAIIAFFVLKKPAPAKSPPNSDLIPTTLTADLQNALTAQLMSKCPTANTSSLLTSTEVACPGATGQPTDPTQVFETVKCYGVQCMATNSCPDTPMVCGTPLPVYFPKWYYIDQCDDYVPNISKEDINSLNEKYTKCNSSTALWLDILSMFAEFAAGALLGPMEGALGTLGADAATGAGVAFTNGIFQMGTQYAVNKGIAQAAQDAQNAKPSADSGKGLSFDGTNYGSGDWWSLQHLIDNPGNPDPPPNWELVADPKHTYVYRVGSINGQITDQLCSGSASECGSRTGDATGNCISDNTCGQ